jgi:hypothetical protein
MKQTAFPIWNCKKERICNKRKDRGSAPPRIRKICLNLIEHYTKQIQPNEYKR